MVLQIKDIVDDRLCYEKVRELRWSEGVICPKCQSGEHERHGHHNACEHRYRYQCKKCSKYFDDLANTVFQGHHQPLKVWIICLYLMSLNLSNAQISKDYILLHLKTDLNLIIFHLFVMFFIRIYYFLDD